MRGLLYSIAFLTFISCGSEGSDNSSRSTEPKAPDSTAYYDSVAQQYLPRIEAFFDQRIKERRFNGAYLFAQNGHILASGYHGYANWKTKDTLSLEHRFQLASASKPFTATAVLQLIDKGKLDPDVDIRKYIPNLPYEGITVRQLLSHRGGLSKYTSFMEPYWKDTMAGFYMTNDDVINQMAIDTPMIYYPPDKTFDYSNTGYAVLAYLVECVSGQRFKDYMKENVFEPAGMETAFIIDKSKNPEPDKITQGHLWDYRFPGNDYINGVVGDKGMYASVDDLLAYDKALREGTILSTEVCLEMTSPQNPIKRDSTCYGYGWRLINPEAPEAIVYHTGWWQGHRTWFIRYPKENKVAIVLDNVKRGPFFSVKELIGLITEDYP